MISKLLRDKIVKHAEEESPLECCGLIVGDDYIKCNNVARDPLNSFAIDPVEMSLFDNIKYVVHSHCGDGATSVASVGDVSACNAVKIPYLIVSYPECDFNIITPKKAPLVGRHFVLGYSDCWTVICDYYKLTRNKELTNYSVDYHWWDEGESLYLDNYEKEGFVDVTGSELIEGDVIIMQIRSNVPNHAGVICSDGMLLHHLYGRLSEKTHYVDYWRNRTVKVIRFP